MTTKHLEGLEGQWRGRAQSLVLDDVLKTGGQDSWGAMAEGRSTDQGTGGPCEWLPES